MRWVVPAVVVATAATAAGGLVARQIYAEPGLSSPAAVVPDGRAVPAGEQPGDTTVRATIDAAEHPLYPTVRQVLQTYFDAINDRRYAQWRSVVTRNKGKDPEEKWRGDYRSTKDGSIVVHRIESGPPNTARVLLGFTSVQDLDDAPLELPETCIRWRLVWPFVIEDGTWKIDAGTTNIAPQHEKC